MMKVIIIPILWVAFASGYGPPATNNQVSNGCGLGGCGISQHTQQQQHVSPSQLTHSVVNQKPTEQRYYWWRGLPKPFTGSNGQSNCHPGTPGCKYYSQPGSSQVPQKTIKFPTDSGSAGIVISGFASGSKFPSRQSTTQLGSSSGSKFPSDSSVTHFETSFGDYDISSGISASLLPPSHDSNIGSSISQGFPSSVSHIGSSSSVGNLPIPQAPHSAGFISQSSASNSGHYNPDTSSSISEGFPSSHSGFHSSSGSLLPSIPSSPGISNIHSQLINPNTGAFQPHTGASGTGKLPGHSGLAHSSDPSSDSYSPTSSGSLPPVSGSISSGSFHSGSGGFHSGGISPSSGSSHGGSGGLPSSSGSFHSGSASIPSSSGSFHSGSGLPSSSGSYHSGSGLPSSSGSYHSGSGSFHSGSGGLPSSSGSFHSGSGGLPSSSGSFPSGSGGLPSSSGSFPSGSAGLPSSSGSFHSDSGGLPSSSGSFHSGSGGLPSSSGPFPSGSGGLPSSSGSFHSNSGGLPSSSGSFHSGSGGLPSSSGSFHSGSGGLPSSSGSFHSGSGGLPSSSGSFHSGSGGLPSSSGSFHSGSGGFHSGGLPSSSGSFQPNNNQNYQPNTQHVQGLPFQQGLVDPLDLKPLPTNFVINGMQMMMMPMGMNMIGGSCSAGSFCIPNDSCNPYTGFIIRNLAMLAAVRTDLPQVPLLTCINIAAGLRNGVCCQEAHPIIGPNGQVVD